MKNKLRIKLSSGKRLFGTHVIFQDYRVCEMLGGIGFDYLWIDMEHTSNDYAIVEQHMIAAKAMGTPSVVRVAWKDVQSIKRVLEMGPDAIVVPMVNSVDEAQQVIDTCIYPPEGNRGCGPMRAINYGRDNIQEYIYNGSKEMVRLVMIETKAAVEALEEMAKIPYLDGFVIGPMDMSGSVGALGYPLQDEETNRLIDLAIRTAHSCGKPIGLSTGAYNEEEISHWIGKGVDFISAGTDVSSVLKGATDILNLMKKVSDTQK